MFVARPLFDSSCREVQPQHDRPMIDHRIASQYSSTTLMKTTTTSPPRGATTRRPPMPRPFADRDGSNQDFSESSRGSLRQSMLKRESSLTLSERKYLSELCDNGNEVEVQLAHKRLQDDDLFFDGNTIDGARRDSSSSHNIPDFSLMDNVSDPSIHDLSEHLPETSSSYGSGRRQQTLEERRRSPILGQIWRAHENGMLVTKEASRRSLFRRSTISNKRDIGIFREEMDDIKSDNNRRALSSTRKLRYSRSKSVTFKDSSEMDSSSRSLPQGRSFSRSSSIGSIPSIRPAHHIHSSSSSVSSRLPIPSPRSFSFGRASSIFSLPSLHRAHSIHSQSEFDPYFDDFVSEKKTDEALFALPIENGIQDATQILAHPPIAGRPVLLRRASTTAGEGVEVFDVPTECNIDVLSSSSFDETMSVQRVASDIFRRIEISKTFSDDSAWRMHESSGTLFDDDASWRFGEEENGDDEDGYDPWKVIEDEYVNGYGGGGTLPFKILGTSVNDVSAHPHVLSPPLMESLQAFLPVAESGDNFWMKYSLVKHGASFYTFLQQARGARNSILAIETIDGEVFGAYTSEPWRKNWNYFGNGQSFIWKMRQSRKTKSQSIFDQAHLESEIDVYPFTGVNSNVQLCLHDRLAVGGGTLDDADREDDPEIKDHEWGFGLTVTDNLLKGTSAPCLTFGSPSLSASHTDGSEFEIMNLELWTLTSCDDEDAAERLELGKLFLEQSFS